MTAPLLVELQVEDLPPRLDGLAANFGAKLDGLLRAEGLLAGTGGPESLQGPRRLAVFFAAVRAASPAVQQLRRGPARALAYDQAGEPTAALRGFLRSARAASEQLIDIEHNGAPYVGLSREVPARPLAELLGGLLDRALGQTTAPRLMRWGAGSLRFVRPVHGICAIHGAQELPVAAAGLTAGARTRGHRFLAPQPFTLPEAGRAAYEAALKQRRVIAGAAERRQLIAAQGAALAAKAGCRWAADEQLLDEVAAMCEWPTCHLGSFAGAAELPPQIVADCLKKHLRCFALLRGGELANQFIFVADNEFADPAVHVRGLERVVRARLDDARFCYAEDRKLDTAQLLGKLDGISYLKNLGSVAAQAGRIAKLVEQFAPALGLDDQQRQSASEAARLCKAAQGTLLANEYPDSAGLLAACYVRDCSSAARDLLARYQNRAEDRGQPERARLPALDCLVLAHACERIAAIAATQQSLSGAKDPFGLRRGMRRVLRVAAHYPHADCFALLDAASKLVAAAVVADGQAKQKILAALPGKLAKVRAQLRDRVRQLAGEWLDAAHDPAVLARITDAVLAGADAASAFRPHDVRQRIVALYRLHAEHRADCEALLAAHKRLANIARASSAHGAQINPELLSAAAERALFSSFTELQQHMGAQQKAAQPASVERYLDLLRRQSKLGPSIDAFFDSVLVNDPDPALSANRHALAGGLLALFSQTAHMEKLYR